MGCLVFFLLSPVAFPCMALFLAGDFAGSVARCLRSAEDLRSVGERLLGILGMCSPSLVLIGMLYGLEGVPLGVLALVSIAAAVASFCALYRRIRLDLMP